MIEEAVEKDRLEGVVMEVFKHHLQVMFELMN